VTLRLLPLVMATFAVGTDNFVLAGLLPAIARDLGTTTATAGQLVTVFALTFALSASVLGAATSGLNRRTALLLALGVFSAGNVLTTLGTTYSVVMAARVVTALGAGLINSAALSTAAAMAPPERRGWAMSVVLGGLSASTAIGLPLGTLIGGTDWRRALLVIAGLGVLTMAGVAFRLPPVSLPASTLRTRLVPLRDTWVVAALVATTLLFSGTYLLYTYIATALRPVTHGSVNTLSAVLALFGVGTVVGTLVSGRLTDRIPAERVLSATLVFTAAVLAVSPWCIATLPGTVIWILVWGACASISTVPLQYRLVQHAPSASAVLLGLSSSSIYLGISLGGALGGALLAAVPAARLGLPAALLTLLSLALVLSSSRLPARAAGSAVPAPAHDELTRGSSG
jgi:DHA1 family inner membrane transport protein